MPLRVKRRRDSVWSRLGRQWRFNCPCTDAWRWSPRPVDPADDQDAAVLLARCQSGIEDFGSQAPRRWLHLVELSRL